MRRAKHIVLAMGLLLSMQAWAWGPAVHAYLIQRITGTQNLEAIYGSIVPDFYLLALGNPTAKAKLQRLTHYEFDRLEEGWFSIGFASHNGEWGADYYAHLYYNPEAPDIFSVVKIRQLSTEFGITMQVAEDIFEATVDFLVRMDCGPVLGTLIREGATHSGHEQDLVDAFAQPLSERVPGMSLAEAQETIRSAAAASQQLTAIYGEQLEQDEAFLRTLIPAILVTTLGCPPDLARQYFERAEAICADEHAAEMDRICALVEAEMDARARYRVPLAPGGMLLLALLVGGAGVRRLRRKRSAIR